MGTQIEGIGSLLMAALVLLATPIIMAIHGLFTQDEKRLTGINIGILIMVFIIFLMVPGIIWQGFLELMLVISAISPLIVYVLVLWRYSPPDVKTVAADSFNYEYSWYYAGLHASDVVARCMPVVSFVFFILFLKNKPDGTGTVVLTYVAIIGSCWFLIGSPENAKDNWEKEAEKYRLNRKSELSRKLREEEEKERERLRPIREAEAKREQEERNRAYAAREKAQADAAAERKRKAQEYIKKNLDEF